MDITEIILIFAIGGCAGTGFGVLLALWLWDQGKAVHVIRGRVANVFGNEVTQRIESTKASPADQVMPEAVNKVTDAMARAMSALPKIQEVSQIFSGLSKEERDKLAIPLGIEYQQAMTQLTAQELEAVTKLREIGLRLSLYLNKVKLVAVSAPAELETALEAIAELESIATQQTAKLKTPEWTGVAQATQAQKAAEFLREVAHVPETIIKDVTAPFLTLPEEIDESEHESQTKADTKSDASRNGHKRIEIFDTDFKPLRRRGREE